MMENVSTAHLGRWSLTFRYVDVILPSAFPVTLTATRWRGRMSTKSLDLVPHPTRMGRQSLPPEDATAPGRCWMWLLWLDNRPRGKF